MLFTLETFTVLSATVFFSLLWHSVSFGLCLNAAQLLECMLYALLFVVFTISKRHFPFNSIVVLFSFLFSCERIKDSTHTHTRSHIAIVCQYRISSATKWEKCRANIGYIQCDIHVGNICEQETKMMSSE